MRVVAIERGFDNLVVREVGDVFDMPDDVFELRPKRDEKGQPIPGQFYDAPSWFEPADEKVKAKLVREREAVHGVKAVDPAKQQHSREETLKKP